MGACLAQMAAVRFQEEQWWPADQMFYFGYGAPRCGNEVILDRLTAKLLKFIFRTLPTTWTLVWPTSSTSFGSMMLFRYSPVLDLITICVF